MLLLWLEFVSAAAICVIEGAAHPRHPYRRRRSGWLIPLPLVLLMALPVSRAVAGSVIDFLMMGALGLMAAVPFLLVRGFRPWYVLLVWGMYVWWLVSAWGMWVLLMDGSVRRGY